MRHRSFRTPAVLSLLLLVAGWSNTFAADPIYLRTPVDEITLNEANGNVTLQVQAINLPVRKMPTAAKPTDEIEIELLDRPGDKFRVAWGSITNIKFFEQAVLAEALEKVQAGNYDEAHAYFEFLEEKYPQTAGLATAVEGFLWVQIGNAFKADRNDEALALLIELYGRNPQRAGLSTAYERVTAKLVESHVAAENYRAARGLLKNLRARFPQSAVIAEQEAKLQSAAGKFYAEAKQNLAAGDLRAAHIASRKMIDIWPIAASGQQLAAAIHARYPLVTVGVTSTAGIDSPLSQDAWAVQRTQRLLGRELFEPAISSDEQGPYHSTVAELIAGDDPRHITLRLKPNLVWPKTGNRVTAREVAQCLLERAEPGNPAFDAAWGEMCSGLSVPGVFELQIAFRNPVARPEALLQTTIGGNNPLADADAVRSGSYRIDSQAKGQTHFTRQTPKSAGASGGPSEIVERLYPDAATALRALKRGEVSLVDRVPPRELKKLAGKNDVVVAPYAYPTVHLLVPNPSRPLTSNRQLRRAMLYGIDRASILQRGLLVEQTIEGCEVLSGPFPRAAFKNDPHAYAYDAAVKPRPYDAGLAIALAGTAIREERVAAKLRGDAPIDAAPVMILQHPAEAVARIACRSIARQLQLLGLKVTLQEIAPGEMPSEDYDLRYVELAMREPVADVWRVLGSQGIVGTGSPAMSQALQSLAVAEDWQQTVAQLHAIHRLAAADLPVIPLWQIVDHFAYHPSVKGIPPRPFRLYQDVEQWQSELRIPSE